MVSDEVGEVPSYFDPCGYEIVPGDGVARKGFVGEVLALFRDTAIVHWFKRIGSTGALPLEHDKTFKGVTRGAYDLKELFLVKL